MKRFCFVLLICVSLVCVFLTPCFAAAETTASESVDWTDPIDSSYFAYHTRSGVGWLYDLPSSPAVAPVTFQIHKHGNTSTVNYVTVPAGASFYVTHSDSDYNLIISDNGTDSSYIIRGFTSSGSVTYYTQTPSVTNVQGTNLFGSPVVIGGSFINSGFSNAVGILGSLASWMLTDSVILVVIGLAVGVTLIGWGIGKVKSTVKGY